MTAILIEINDNSELDFIRELLNRMKIKNIELNKEEYEDTLLGLKMISEKTGELVAKEEITKKLTG